MNPARPRHTAQLSRSLFSSKRYVQRFKEAILRKSTHGSHCSQDFLHSGLGFFDGSLSFLHGSLGLKGSLFFFLSWGSCGHFLISCSFLVFFFFFRMGVPPVTSPTLIDPPVISATLIASSA